MGNVWVGLEFLMVPRGEPWGLGSSAGIEEPGPCRAVAGGQGSPTGPDFSPLGGNAADI